MPIQVSVLPTQSNTSACFSTSSFFEDFDVAKLGFASIYTHAHEAGFFAQRAEVLLLFALPM